SVTFLSDHELRAVGVPDAMLMNPKYVKACRTCERAEWFDAPFFGFTPREAQITDPQVRMFLQAAWEVFELAAYEPKTYGGLIGVYAGLGSNSYLSEALSRKDLVDAAGAMT